MANEQERVAIVDGLVGMESLSVSYAALVEAWEPKQGEPGADARWRLHRLAWSLEPAAGVASYMGLAELGTGACLVPLDETLARAGAKLRLVEAAIRGAPPGIELPPSEGEPGYDMPIIGYVTPEEAGEAAPLVLALDEIENNELHSALLVAATEHHVLLFIASADEGPEEDTDD